MHLHVVINTPHSTTPLNPLICIIIRISNTLKGLYNEKSIVDVKEEVDVVSYILYTVECITPLSFVEDCIICILTYVLSTCIQFCAFNRTAGGRRGRTGECWRTDVVEGRERYEEEGGDDIYY